MTSSPVRDADYELLWVGTPVVTTTASGVKRHGFVGDYEQHRPNQHDFPVQFGARWEVMTSLDVQECFECEPHSKPHPPRLTYPGTLITEPEPQLPQQRGDSPAVNSVANATA